jgi:tetratricopeptide (TPR) repeat protein
VGTHRLGTGVTTFTAGDQHVALGDFGVAEWQGDAADPPPLAVVFALNRRGLQRWQSGHFQGALDDYARALELAPNFAPVHNNRALVWVALGELDLALADAENAVHGGSDAGLPFTLATRGYVLYKRGDHEAALADFDASVERRSPPAATVLLGRGLTRLALGDRDGAREDLAEGVRSGENLPPDPELDDLLPAARQALASLQEP